MPGKKPLVLIILDGWGHRQEQAYNAIAKACTPQWDDWWQHYPHLLLDASGPVVGLPENQMGNSEVGHMHLGAGRIIDQDLTRINQAIDTGLFFTNSQFLQVINHTKASNNRLHVIGLLSDGGVHSHQDHLFAFLTLCHQHQLDNVILHLIVDGRDTPPLHALASIEKLNQHLIKFPVARIASISGRYFAMDRDNRWERIKTYYTALTQGISAYQFPDAFTAVNAFYQKNISDEFIPPTLIGSNALINNGDSIFFFNFRADRARELTQSFVDDIFYHFNQVNRPKLAYFMSMTHYADNLPTLCAFPPQQLINTFGELVANAGLKQLRLAETEKYAHVTFFFNGGAEQPFANEDRLLIPSPNVATYDLAPEMSADKITKALIKAVKSEVYDVIICNYANADMVGHTGDFNATVKAIECLDNCFKQLAQLLSLHPVNVVITADHGNAESMYNVDNNQPHKAHTSELIPLLYVGNDWHFDQQQASLVDVAPTLLALLNLDKPKEMTGRSLLVANHAID